MKNSTMLVLAFATFLLLGGAMQSAGYFPSIVVRNTTTLYGTLTSSATETHSGTVTFTGTTNIASPAVTGLSTFDSVKVNGIFKQGGATSDGTAFNYFKGNNTRLYISKWFRGSSSTAVATLDTSGNFAGAKGTFTSLATSASALAARDSFSTTAVLKGVYMPGATVTSVFSVTPRVYGYSATPDTGMDYYVRFDNADSISVLRVKKLTTSSVKSGALFDVVQVIK